MVTIKDVAKKANVSISTASYAINDSSKVNKETALRIKKIANELGYFPNSQARNLKLKKTKIIGVFIANFGGPVYHEFLDGIQKKLAEKGYSMVVTAGSSCEKMIKDRTTDGAIIYNSNISEELIKSIASKKFPIIVVNKNYLADNLYTCMIDNIDIYYELIKETLNKGYKDYAYVHGSPDSMDEKERFIGFKKALTEQKILNFKEYQGYFTRESGRNVALQMIKDNKVPKMICCANDEMALGIIDILHENKYEILKDYGICGFDDIEASSLNRIPLSTIKIDRFLWGGRIAEAICDLNSGSDVKLELQKGKIILRGSF